MEMMRIGMNKLVRMLALSLVAASSFSSCMVETPEDGFEAADQERPVANYQIMGKVTDKDGNPVNGIRVIADYNTDVIYRADTLYTNKEGEYSKFMAIPRVDKFRMSFSDIDGSANGGDFKSVSKEVKLIRTEMAAGHFGGSYVVSFDAVLQRR